VSNQRIADLANVPVAVDEKALRLSRRSVEGGSIHGKNRRVVAIVLVKTVTKGPRGCRKNANGIVALRTVGRLQLAKGWNLQPIAASAVFVESKCDYFAVIQIG